MQAFRNAAKPLMVVVALTFFAWLVVDLSGCSYLDSAGLRVIARVDVRCRDAGSGLRLVVERGSSIDRVLAMTHMDEVLTVDRLLRDALVSALDDIDGTMPGGSEEGAAEP